MMNTEKFDMQYVFNTIKAIGELVEIILNPSDYGLSKIGERNLELRIMQMHNQLPL